MYDALLDFINSAKVPTQSVKPSQVGQQRPKNIRQVNCDGKPILQHYLFSDPEFNYFTILGKQHSVIVYKKPSAHGHTTRVVGNTEAMVRAWLAYYKSEFGL